MNKGSVWEGVGTGVRGLGPTSMSRDQISCYPRPCMCLTQRMCLKHMSVCVWGGVCMSEGMRSGPFVSAMGGTKPGEESKVGGEAWRIWRPRLSHVLCSMSTSELWQ